MSDLTIPRELLDELAPEETINQDECGGCVWCGGTPPGQTYGYARRCAEDHFHDCPWLTARRILEPDADDLQPNSLNLTGPQQLLLERIKEHAPLPVRGSDSRVAEVLHRKQLIRIVNHGTPWTKGWYRMAELP